MSAIQNLIQNVQLDEAKSFGRLAMFPVRVATMAATHAPFTLLDDAIADGGIEISEVSEGGSVPVLTLSNKANTPVLLLDGEELVGAKQNRILNTSVLAPPKADTSLPVSCVEQGRWRYVSRQFRNSRQTLFAKGRARKAERMMASRKAGASRFDLHDAGQGEIWNDVSDKLEAMGVASASSAMTDSYDMHDASLETFEAAMAPADGQCGAVFAMDGKIVGVEILPSAAAYAKVHGKFVRSWALDALEGHQAASPAPAPKTDALAFLAKLVGATPHSAPGVGLGEDVRIEGDSLVGHALVHKGKVLHLAAFDSALAT